MGESRPGNRPTALPSLLYDFDTSTGLKTCARQRRAGLAEEWGDTPIAPLLEPLPVTNDVQAVRNDHCGRVWADKSGNTLVEM